MYSLPLLKDYLPTKYYKGWSFFMQAVQLCQKKVITMDELNNIDTLLLKFYVHYEREYYKFSANRLSAMKMCIHYILHVVASIKRNGPCCTTWQFPIEPQVEGAPLSKIQKMQIPHFPGKWWEIVENAALR
ncbi:hypothetical protein RhiirA1_453301 [Rhizophagus irregularis]|uniref:Uncharacterized protein n=1 Tax=Rhizophagus irregularis TaxID=588596 RepID=A0A2N0S7Y5_9GLOM|nr:hypothetical protein RhiirA1_453301 [Rhizophagus irregularis]